MHKPAGYWRSTDDWKYWLGKQGTVVALTVVHVAPPHLKDFAPYSYVIVEFDGERRECIGADHQEFKVGDKVECVLRKMSVPSKEQLIPYGIKVAKVRK
jgi:uncharacterized OB-fold protein